VVAAVVVGRQSLSSIQGGVQVVGLRL